MKIEKYAITTKTYGTPLISPVKKYTRLSSSNGVGPGSRDAGIILLLTHGAGFLKETWEPTIEELFRLDTQAGTPRIREIWSVDAQNHGEGWTLNEHILAHNPDLATIYDFGEAIAELVKSGLLGIVDPRMNPIIACGHSGGSVAAIHATSFFNPPPMVPISRLILVDPPLWSKAKDGQHTDMYNLISNATPVRKDIWKDFETASQWLRKRFPWDKRVLDIYIKYGLRALPTAQYPDKTSGVTLTTSKLGENMAYTGLRYGYEAVYRLNQICTYIPVHLIYGARNDMFDRDVQDSLIDPKEGRVFESVTRMEGVGHLVVQEAPIKLAVFIYDILSNVSLPTPSKL